MKKKIGVFLGLLLASQAMATELKGRIIEIVTPNKFIMLDNGTALKEVFLYATSPVFNQPQPIGEKHFIQSSMEQKFQNRFEVSGRYQNVFDKKMKTKFSLPNMLAIQYLQQHVLGKQAKCEVIYSEPYLCDLYIGEKWINAEMIMKGLLSAEVTNESPELILMMNEAKRLKKGLWGTKG